MGQFNIFVIAYICLILASCSKENIQEIPTHPTSQGSLSVSDFLSNGQDLAEKKFNQCIYDVGISARSILNNSTIIAALLKEAHKSNHHQVDLLEFLDATGKRSQFRNNLAGQTANDPSTFNDESYISENLIYDQTYRMKILIYNLDNFRTYANPWIIPTLPINENIYPQYPDGYLVWKANGASFSMEVISESAANSSVVPVIIIGNGEELNSLDILDIKPTHLDKRPSLVDFPKFGVTTCQVNARYEASGDSEFRIVVVDGSTFNTNGDPDSWFIDATLTPTQCTTAAVFTMNRGLFLIQMA